MSSDDQPPATAEPDNEDSHDDAAAEPRLGRVSDAERRRPIRPVILGTSIAAALGITVSAAADSASAPLDAIVLLVFGYLAAVVAYRRSFGRAIGVVLAAAALAGLWKSLSNWTIAHGMRLGDLTAVQLGEDIGGLIGSVLVIALIAAGVSVAVRRIRGRTPGSITVRKAALDRAERAVRMGVFTAIAVGLLMAVAVTIAVVGDARDGLLAPLNDPWMYLDAVIPLGLAYFMQQRSRTATTLMVGYYVWGRIYWSLEVNYFAGGVVALALIYLLARATWGSFVYHKLMRAAGTPVPPPPPWKTVLATLGTTSVILLSLYGMMIQGGLVPSGVAITGEEMEQRHITALVSEGIIGPDEEILYFYSDGAFSILEDGNLFTTDRVVTYVGNGQAFWCDSARFEEIVDIDVQFAEGLLDNTTITIVADDWRTFYLVVSTESKRDETFARVLQDRWREARARADTLDEPAVWYDGGGGESVDDAIIVLGARFDIVGTVAELEWISLRFGMKDEDWRFLRQTSHRIDEREIDEITIEPSEGEERSIFFDVTESFGKPAPDSWYDERAEDRAETDVATL